MNEPLAHLLYRLGQGELLSGAYRRRSLKHGQSIQFAELVVWTADGATYSTLDPGESELFFRTVIYRGSGMNSGFCEERGCFFYESVGNWHSQQPKPISRQKEVKKCTASSPT